MKTFGGYTSWLAWLAGKALPVTLFTLLVILGTQHLSREVVQLAYDGLRLYPVMEVLRRCLMLGFLLLVVAAYLTRTHALAQARGFWERAFPMVVLLATIIAMSFLGHAAAPHRLDLAGAGLPLTLLGFGISLWALWHLRGSFAIMAEARPPVTSGPYQYVRHPLYLGEMLSMLGFCLMIGSAIGLLFWVALTGMQLTRARIEEAKLAGQFDDYRAYRQRTRFFLPGLY